MARKDSKPYKIANWLTPEGLEKISNMAAKGFSKQQIAKGMGCTDQTLIKYRKDYPEIQKAIDDGTEKAINEMENALFRNGLGHYGINTKNIKVKEVIYENGKKIRETEKIVPVEEKIYVPPNVVAQMYYLQNKAPDRWQDKRNVTVDTKVSFADILSDRRMKRAEVVEVAKLPKTQEQP